MPHQLMDELAAIGAKMGQPDICFTPFANLLRTAVEAVVLAPSIAMVRRCCCTAICIFPAATAACLVGCAVASALLM
jgi:hypothetical protein